MDLFEKHGFFYAKPLFSGTLDECYNYDIKFNSVLPKQLGLPKLAKNQCEGVVIKTIEPSYTFSGKRRIFKKKNERFAEVNPKVEKTLYEVIRDREKENVERCYEEIDRYINDNRMDTLRSKIGEFDMERKNEVSELYCADVMKDFIDDQEELWDAIPDDKKRKNSQ